MRASISVALLALLGAKVIHVAMAQPGSGMECRDGPLPRNYAGTDWNIYACADGKSIVVVIAKSSPELPFFYFYIRPLGDNIELHGEGNGDKKLTEPAFKELSTLTSASLAELVARANRIHRSPTAK